MAGRFFSNEPCYDYKGYLENLKPVIEKTYTDYTMIGGAGTLALQSFLFKLELAFKSGFGLQGLDASNLYVLEKKDILDSAVGIEYNANDKYQMSFEIASRYIFSDISTLVPSTDQSSSAFYYIFTKDFLHQTLRFEYDFYYHLREHNQFHKFQLAYDITDRIEILAGYAHFEARDEQSIMWLYRDENRLSLEIKYFF
jgi:hypothetical protein